MNAYLTDAEIDSLAALSRDERRDLTMATRDRMVERLAAILTNAGVTDAERHAIDILSRYEELAA